MTRRKHAFPFTIVISALALAACSGGGLQGSENAASADIDAIKSAGVLRVATRNAPTTYYINRNRQPVGPEYAMARAFADSVGVELELVETKSVSKALAAVENGKADLAAAGLTATAGRANRFAFGPSYQQVSQQVVCRTRSKQAKSVEELSSVNLVVIADSSYDERLQSLKQEHPALVWQTNAKQGTEQLLHQVWKKKIDCTVADSNIVDINQRYYPQLKVMFELSEPEPLAWAMGKQSHTLHSAVNDWFENYKSSGDLAAMHARYYGYIPEFDYVEKSKLVERIDERYSKYDHLFEKAADKHNIPVGLLAAQGYQESHWDPLAKSPTGVRGIMMLTNRTAKSLGVDNRLDPKQSIYGGAQYLEKMQGRLDESIEEPDRTYFALAAYNVGLAHLRDAQKLATQFGKDPHSWSDVREVLPKLSEKRYYSKLKYGYARGTEPVRYVQRIRDYEDVIAKHTQ